jgi:hypothetical protein
LFTKAFIMISLKPHARGVILPVRAKASARRCGVTGVHDGMLKVSVTQAPERGKANKKIIEVVAERLLLRRSQIELLAGATSPEKQLLVRDISIDELEKRIGQAVGKT